MVKRYDIEPSSGATVTYKTCADGAHVDYQDYEKLEKENAELRAKVDGVYDLAKRQWINSAERLLTRKAPYLPVCLRSLAEEMFDNYNPGVDDVDACVNKELGKWDI